MATNNPGTGAAPAVNSDLKAVHTELIAIARSLDSAVGRAQTAAEVNAILGELSDVTARIVALGRQLFKQQTSILASLSQDVIAASAEAKEAIRRLDDVKGFIEGLTRFLGLVDKLIDTAKVVI